MVGGDRGEQRAREMSRAMSVAPFEIDYPLVICYIAIEHDHL